MENEYYGIYLDDGLPSPSVESTRRELFYKWFDEQQSLAERCGLSLGNAEFEFAEAAFNAALDAVEIELPKGESNMTTGALHMISRCHQSIESLSLGLKIK